MKRTIVFIPARGDSKSIPLKNIKLFCGKPLIYWVVKAMSDSKKVDDIFVATDSEKIEAVAKGFGFNKLAIYRRDERNARDSSSTESVMLEFLQKNKDLKNDDIFVLAQATSPFTSGKDIDNALDIFKKSQADSILSCVKIKRFFWSELGKPLNYNHEKRPRRQDFDGNFMENGAFYINTVGNIKKYRNRLSGKISIYEMPPFSATEIDDSDDWIVAEHLMKKHILS